jgi:hypothetical protein
MEKQSSSDVKMEGHIQILMAIHIAIDYLVFMLIICIDVVAAFNAFLAFTSKSKNKSLLDVNLIHVRNSSLN